MTSSTREPESVPSASPHWLRRRFDSQLDAGQKRAIRKISSAAARAGLPIYLVGGSVRDLLLGKALRDLDLAIEGELEGLLKQLDGPKTSHPAFGTATVELECGQHVDLARTRAESYAHPAALPRVRAADIRTDLGRRDFTVNAIALRIEAGRAGALIDPHHGCRDLERRRLAILHPRSFVDDPTRGFRAVRLAGELGFALEPSTRRALMDARSAGLFESLSSARLAREAIRLLDSPASGKAIRLARRLGLLGTFVDGPCRYATVDRIAWLKRRLSRQRRKNPDEPLCEWISVLALCMWPTGAPGFTITRLQPPRRQRRALERLPAMAALAGLLARARLRPSEVRSACEDVPVELLLMLAAVGSSRRRQRIGRFLDRWRGVRPDIDARQLLELGVPSGPLLAAALRRALAGKLDGRARGPRGQLQMALEESEDS